MQSLAVVNRCNCGNAEEKHADCTGAKNCSKCGVKICCKNGEATDIGNEHICLDCQAMMAYPGDVLDGLAGASWF